MKIERIEALKADVGWRNFSDVDIAQGDDHFVGVLFIGQNERTSKTRTGSRRSSVCVAVMWDGRSRRSALFGCMTVYYTLSMLGSTMNSPRCG